MNSNHSTTSQRKEGLTENRSLYIFGLLCLAAFAFKLALLYYRKMYIDPDEGYYLLLAQNILDGAGYGFNGLPNIVFPPLLPGLIAAVSLLVSELQVALGLITALSGMVMGCVAFLMMRQKNIASTPILAGGLVLFIPTLNDFIPVAGIYTKNLYRGSDILNVLFVFTVLYFLTLALKKKHDWLLLAAGAVLGLAYLTRPEALLLFLLLVGWLVLLWFLRLIPLSPKKILLFGCAFLLVAAPYIFFLKTVTGQWMLSGKVGASQNYRNSLIKVITNEDWHDFSEIHYSLDQKTWEMNDMYWGFHPGLSIDSGFSVPILFKNALENIRLGWKVPLTIIPVYLWVFAIPGLVLGLGHIFRRNSSSDLILLILFPYSLFLLTMTYPIPRHHLFLTPVLCIYATRGIAWTSDLIRQRLELRATATKRISLLIGIIILMLFVGKYLKNYNQSALHHPGFQTMTSVEDSISRYIQEQGGRAVMSGHPRMAVGAKSDWQVLPQVDLTVALQFAHQKKVDYIVWRYGSSQENPYLLVDVNQSYIPSSPEEKITHKTIDQQHLFQLVKILPLADQVEE